MGKSWMSQVLLPSVIGSLLTYALLPNGPFPPFPSTNFTFLRCTLGITQQLLWCFPAAATTANSRDTGGISNSTVLTAAAKQKEKVVL